MADNTYRITHLSACSWSKFFYYQGRARKNRSISINMLRRPEMIRLFLEELVDKDKYQLKAFRMLFRVLIIVFVAFCGSSNVMLFEL